jgi:hypothetical protein
MRATCRANPTTAERLGSCLRRWAGRAAAKLHDHRRDLPFGAPNFDVMRHRYQQ